MLLYYFSYQYNRHALAHLLREGFLLASEADFERSTYSEFLIFLLDSRLAKSNQNRNFQLLKKQTAP